MDNTINFHTLNVRSIAQNKKRKAIFKWLQEKHKGIIFLQETHSVPNNDWDRDWAGNMILAHGTSKSCGVAILISPGITFDLTEVQSDPEGRYLIIKCILENEAFTLINTYFPTKDHQKEQIKLLEKIQNIVSKNDSESIIWGGDINLVLDINKDKVGGRNMNDCKSFRMSVKSLLDVYNLEDVT